jgi:hypothetical protein
VAVEQLVVLCDRRRHFENESGVKQEESKGNGKRCPPFAKNKIAKGRPPR